tara:strand:- start:1563 stop:1814 length:252 start_codon:yes stop_codon:yes gene_type:complete
MNSKNKKYKKDSYSRYVDNEDFSKYWEDEEDLLELSLKESRRQKEYRKKWHSDLTQIGVKVCAICGNEECICEYFDDKERSEE